MAASSLNRPPRARLAARGVAVLLGCAAAVSQAAVAAEPRAVRRDAAVTLDAASSDVDYRSNTVVFRDIVITQGGVRVAAAQARATGLDFEDSTWNFSGAVRINVDGGALRSDEATVRFGANRVSNARIRGNPAEFEQSRAGSTDLARGRAATIEYDVAAGTVKLIGDAWLSDGRNEIRGQQLTYDVRSQRVQSGTRPGQSDRVQITIRPRDADESAAPTGSLPGAVPGPAQGPATGPGSGLGPAPPTSPPRAELP
jgi:lipopolysaccharide export system protein LptA